MTQYVTRAGIEADPKLADFIETEVLGPLSRDVDGFWRGFAALLEEFAPRNAALLARREDLQAQIDAWHGEHAGKPHDGGAYRAFLQEIGYLV
ncbi:MAG: malate synthase G, partial [Pseudomonadota bacterium]|nr:malate synthase G [Pseudomonadota bacterium]